MTVQELIDTLNKCEDKHVEVIVNAPGGYRIIDRDHPVIRMPVTDNHCVTLCYALVTKGVVWT